MPLFAKMSHGADLRILQVMGTCHSTEVRLSEHSVFFGDVVVGSEATRAVRLNNFGDLGAKFRFDVPAKYAKVFSVSPSEGYVRPQEEIQLTVTFHPTPDRVKEFRRLEMQAAARRGKKTDGDSKEFILSVKDVRCVLDGHSPLTLEASGRCVATVLDSKLLEFSTEVRVPKGASFNITNTTDLDWKLHPQVTTTEPAGVNFFSAAREVLVPAGREATVEITYTPLMMTIAEGADDEAGPGKVPRLEKHRGNVFIGTPDGNAISYQLEGVAAAPKIEKRLEAEVPCKKQHNQRIPVKNWLHERQRFDVKLELVEPDGDKASSITMQGVATLDLPPGLEREYKFNIYARHEGAALVRVHLTSQETGEFMVVEVAFKFFAAQSLATIDLKAACRDLARHKIALGNPLKQEITFTGTSSNPDISFLPESITVPAESERTIELTFRPVIEGSGTADASLTSEELGTYPYTVKWLATAPGLERTLICKAPLGLSIVESFKFHHFARQPVTYTAEIQAAPSQKGNRDDFIVEEKTVNTQAADSNGTEVSLDIKYQPSGLGECRALLVVTGPGGGEYKALLTGFAQPPQPQGPIVMYNGKGDQVQFRNPFSVPTDFSFQVDNPAFGVAMRSKRIDPLKTEPIPVTFKSDKTQGGRLIVSCAQATTPWIFFLKGEL
jgi:hydrocephalus-inducing protein